MTKVREINKGRPREITRPPDIVIMSDTMDLIGDYIGDNGDLYPPATTTQQEYVPLCDLTIASSNLERTQKVLNLFLDRVLEVVKEEGNAIQKVKNSARTGKLENARKFLKEV